MAVEIVMPRLSDSMEEGTILRWLVAPGDEVTSGQPLAEIETDKATVTHEALAGIRPGAKRGDSPDRARQAQLAPGHGQSGSPEREQSAEKITSPSGRTTSAQLEPSEKLLAAYFGRIGYSRA